MAPTPHEDDIFYAAIRRALEDDARIDEAAVEHSGVDHVVAERRTTEEGDDLYEAITTLLREQVNHEQIDHPATGL
jgi:hypothetical protein